MFRLGHFALPCPALAYQPSTGLQKETAEKLPTGEKNYRASLVIIMQTLELCLLRSVSVSRSVPIIESNYISISNILAFVILKTHQTIRKSFENNLSNIIRTRTTISNNNPHSH